MPDISALNGTAIDNVAEFDGLTVTDVPTFVGLLDTYTGAAAGYSTRRLASATTVLLRVRRETAGGTGDDDEADVAYDSNNQLSLDSAISNASAGVTATTLGQFINVGTVNGTTYTNPDSLTVTASCFVDTWYDQAGSNDAEQTAQGSQPQIHNGTVNTDLITENGKPALQLDNTGQDELLFTAVTTCKTVFSVCGTAGTSFSALLGVSTLNTSNDRSLRVISGNVWYLDNAGPEDWYKEANGDAYIDGSQVTGRPSAGSQQLIFLWNTSPTSTYGFSSIGNRNLSRSWYGKIQEIVIYENTDYIDSTNRPAIETDINTYFSIY